MKLKNVDIRELARRPTTSLELEEAAKRSRETVSWMFIDESKYIVDKNGEPLVAYMAKGKKPKPRKDNNQKSYLGLPVRVLFSSF